ncbi:beta-galactosidase GalB [Coprobacter fastidiosus]
MKNRRLLLLCVWLCIGSISLANNLQSKKSDSQRERICLNTGWRFQKNDPEGVTERLDYARLKPYLLPWANDFIKTGKKYDRPAGNPGSTHPYAKADFDDSSWRKLNLPHDWAIEGPFNIDYEGSTGKLPYWGIAWYRRSFDLEADDAEKRIYLDIDGAMSYSSVWCNGNYVGGWPYGYASYRLDLTPYVKAGKKNVLAIRLDNPDKSSRWYPGAGIYRNVWLVKTSSVHVAQWGTFVKNNKVSDKEAVMDMSVSLINHGKDKVKAVVVNDIYEADETGAPKGGIVASVSEKNVELRGKLPTELQFKFSVKSPKLWDIESPNRYVAVTRVNVSGKEIDSYHTIFGIRNAEFIPGKGFVLNGRVVPLKGICMHHDLGALGTAFNEVAAERQFRIMKEIGVNAIRTSHNPPAPEIVELCDRLGLLMQIESFDTWRRGKLKNDYCKLFDEWHEADMRSIVRHYRNHPAVIMWSIGNEMPDQMTADGIKIASDLTSFCHDEDPTRPTTFGSNRPKAFMKEIVNGVDIWGINYQIGQYGKFKEANPGKMFHGSETASAISSRGEYFFPVNRKRGESSRNFQQSSYDMVAVPWGCPPEAQFRTNENNPESFGEFVWTGFDYLGEPTPYNEDLTNILNFTDPKEQEKARKELETLGKIKTPSRSSYFGIVDLCGFPKDRYYCYKSYWRPEIPTLHILPHWNWPERVGEITPVHIYTSGDEVELFLNGKSQGKRKKENRYDRLIWEDVLYQPGELKAVAYKEGKKWAEQIMKTTGEAARIKMSPEKSVLKNDGYDLIYVRVDIQDKNGLTVPRSKNLLKFSVSGPVEIVATDNGDATSLKPFNTPEKEAYNGLCLVIVRALPGKTGDAVLKVDSSGLPAEQVNLKVISDTGN